MTQKERQERSRKEIFQAAMEEFGTNDYDQVTMESICTRHKISKGMMYHYYSGKDELFLQCVDAVFRNLKEYVEQKMPAAEQKDVFQAIKEFFVLREYFLAAGPGKRGSLKMPCSGRRSTLRGGSGTCGGRSVR